MQGALKRRGLLQAALAAGIAPALLRHADAAATALFGLGIASGAPRASTLVLWTRLLGDRLPDRVEVHWEVAEDERFRTVVARGSERAVAAEVHSVHAEPAGLRPGRWYWYRFTALGQQSAVGRTRTAPVADASAPRLRFAIASCQRWDHGEFAAWRDMARQDVDLVLFLGDYIYEYGASKDPKARRQHLGGACFTLDDFRQRYAQYKTDPALQAMHAAAPWITTWDDHEIENDWAGDVSERLDPQFAQRRLAAARAYWEHQPLPRSMRPDAGGWMQLPAAYDWGSLARLITLDDRQWRDPQVCNLPGRGGSRMVSQRDCPQLADPARSLLGARQEAWLARQWDRQRPWNLLAQQTLMQPLGADSEDYRRWTDGWDGYPAARQRLLHDMQAAGARNPVVLGGDLHSHYVSTLKDGVSAQAVASEFCGASISSDGWGQERLDRQRAASPDLQLTLDQRGYMLFELGERRLEMQARSVADIWNPESPLSRAASYVVDAGRVGPQAV